MDSCCTASTPIRGKSSHIPCEAALRLQLQAACYGEDISPLGQLAPTVCPVTFVRQAIQFMETCGASVGRCGNRSGSNHCRRNHVPSVYVDNGLNGCVARRTSEVSLKSASFVSRLVRKRPNVQTACSVTLTRSDSRRCRHVCAQRNQTFRPLAFAFFQ